MPQEYIPRVEYIITGSKQFEAIMALFKLAEERNWPERIVSNVLKNWDMPNEPILSEN
jgi:hypothetical protein